MGIPAYYRTLCSSVPSLLSKTLPIQVGSLWIDFNCIVYHCIRKPEIPKYTIEERINWEDRLIKVVVQYSKQLIKESNIEEGGYIFLGIEVLFQWQK